MRYGHKRAIVKCGDKQTCGSTCKQYISWCVWLCRNGHAYITNNNNKITEILKCDCTQ